jgi:molybdate transport repressor ModE-like protein
VTFAQLRSFATVARLGSVRAAARELGVSEPAVSAAIATLRREFGDELLVRSAGGLKLTPGGARLAPAASEILGVADEARRAVDASHGAVSPLRVAATSEVAEHVAGPLIEAFTRRSQQVEVALQVEPAASFGPLLTDRLADVVLGPRPAAGLDSMPFLRYRLVVVAAPGHELAGRRGVMPGALAGERWLVGPSGSGPGTDVGAFLERFAITPAEVLAFPSDAAAAMAAETGRGVMLAVAHTVLDELRRGTLVRLDVRGTPHEELWHATTLARDRCPDAASALRRFLTTPEATQAMLARPGGVPVERFRPRVHVTLWHS